MMEQLTQEEFIAQVRSVHGDRYDYSKVVYVDNQTKVCIICPKHGEFWKIPEVLLAGVDCPKCIAEEEKEFIRASYEIHGRKYLYLGTFMSMDAHLIITCPTHGNFWTTPEKHINGKGCLECTKETQGALQPQIIEGFRAVHGAKYDYRGLKYKGPNHIILSDVPNTVILLKFPLLI